MKKNNTKKRAGKHILVEHLFHWYAILSIIAFILIVSLYQAYYFKHREATHPQIFRLPINLKPIVRSKTPPIFHWKQYYVRKKDTLERIFKRIGLNEATVLAVLHSGPAAKHLNLLKPKTPLFVHLDEQRQLEALRYRLDEHHTLLVTRGDEGMNARIETMKLEPHVHYVTGHIHDSLYVGAQNAGLPKPLIDELAHVLSWDIDFAHDIQPGDHFTVLYNDYYDKDKLVNIGHILAAEFVNGGHTYRFIRYTDPKGHTDYYTPAGHAVRRAFIRTPVKFTRISSHFDLHRYHPILDIIRPHKGVDYAAPTGTPVKATANGEVIYCGKRGGYGNVIEIDHGKNYRTRYAHLHKFAKGIKKGSHVKQEQLIAYVGKSGLATGPHLHYEFLIRGVHHDPLKVKLPAAKPIDKHFRTAFIAKTNALLAQLDLYRSAMQAGKKKRFG